MDQQELVCESYHVRTVRLAFTTPFVHELVYGFIQRGGFADERPLQAIKFCAERWSHAWRYCGCGCSFGPDW